MEYLGEEPACECVNCCFSAALMKLVPISAALSKEICNTAASIGFQVKSASGTDDDLLEGHWGSLLQVLASS